METSINDTRSRSQRLAGHRAEKIARTKVPSWIARILNTSILVLVAISCMFLVVNHIMDISIKDLQRSNLKKLQDINGFQPVK